MVPRPNLWFCVYKTTCLASELLVSMGPSSHLLFFACKTANLGPELQVYMVPSPHLWFLQAKQRIQDQNDKSLWFPDLTCGFVYTKQSAWHQNC